MLDTSRPASRILSVLELLQNRPGITGPQLADELDVSARTVRRYITTLQDMGVPVEPTTGRFGGYALRPGFRLPPMMFNADEALGNQIEETNRLQWLARELGAPAAAGFGAGFGGAVWALVETAEAESFADRWLAAYLAEFPAVEGRASTIVTRPGGPARRLDS